VWRWKISYLKYSEHGLTNVKRMSPVVIGDCPIVLTHSQQPPHQRLEATHNNTDGKSFSLIGARWNSFSVKAKFSHISPTHHILSLSHLSCLSTLPTSHGPHWRKHFLFWIELAKPAIIFCHFSALLPQELEWIKLNLKHVPFVAFCSQIIYLINQSIDYHQQ